MDICKSSSCGEIAIDKSNIEKDILLHIQKL